MLLPTLLVVLSSAAAQPRCPSGMIYLANAQPFCLDAREVTQAQAKPDSQSGDCAAHTFDAPKSANCITFSAAEQFCRSRNKRLPTEAEWNFAARGSGARIYPWGNNKVNFNPIKPNLCLLRQERTGALGPCVPGRSSADKTPEGIFDLGYNLSEWTATTDAGKQVIRGGSWADRTQEPIAEYRIAKPRDYANPTVGFRCAADPR